MYSTGTMLSGEQSLFVVTLYFRASNCPVRKVRNPVVQILEYHLEYFLLLLLSAIFLNRPSQALQ